MPVSHFSTAIRLRTVSSCASTLHRPLHRSTCTTVGGPKIVQFYKFNQETSSQQNTVRRMRVSCFFVSVLFIFAEGAKDKPFGQVFSKQQKFLSSFSSSSSSLSFLPFSNVLDALYDPNGYCFVAISSDDDNKSALWSAKKSLKGVGEEVYSDWRAVDNGEGASFPAGEMFSKIVKAPDSILLISSSSIYEIVLDFNCTHVTSVNVLLTPVEEWGEVLSASFANINFGDGQSNPSLWIGTEQGLFLFSQFRQESHDVWETIKFQEINERVSSLLWVQEWNQCFVGTPVALYDISIQSKGTTSNDISYKMQYQWIGGNIDTEAKNMVYDSSFDCVWLVQQEALHQRRSDGTWYRQGHYQGLITNNLSSVAVTTQGIGSDNTTHFVWLGSKNRGLLRRQIRQPMTEEGGNEDTGQEDPWKQWLLFYSARYLPDSEIVLIVSDDADGTHGKKNVDIPAQSTLLVVSKLGVSFVTMQEWRLSDKEKVMQSYQYPRHDRHGIVAQVSLNEPGDTSHWYHNCQDSDSIWTAQYAVAAAMRYSITRSDADRISSWRAFEGLEKLSLLSGVAGLVGRTFCSPEEIEGAKKNGGTLNCGVDGENNWHSSSAFPGWVWKGDTSSDTIDGHYFAYGVLLDLVAESPDEKSRVYKCIDDLTAYIVTNDFYYIDITGEPTKWGRWNPADLNDNPEYYSERGLNSLEILAYLALGYSVTGNEEYLLHFQSLAFKYGYYDNALNQKIDNPFEDNHSDNELGHMAYHTLFYSYYRLRRAVYENKLLYNIKDLSELTSRRDVLQTLVAPILPSIRRWWTILRHERSPLWLSVVAGPAGVPLSNVEVERSIESLRLYSSDMISWSVHNSGRWDCPQQPYYGRDNPSNTLMQKIRPPQERVMGHYNIDPFTLDSSHEASDAYSDGGGGLVEYSPAEWLLPYWSLRYYGILQ